MSLDFQSIPNNNTARLFPPRISTQRYNQQKSEQETQGDKVNIERKNQLSSVPLITIPGGTKRKQTAEMLDDYDYKITNGEDMFAAPRSKQRKYEERMSSKLGGIHIGNEPSTQSISQQQSRPKIEEIFDWDEEYLDDETGSTPIVEEPRSSTREAKEEEKYNQQSQKEDEDDILLADEEQPEQKIVLSRELKQFITKLNHGGGTNDLLPGRPGNGLTGKELVLYTPSPLDFRMPPSKASSIFSTSANGTKTQEQTLDNRGKVEEILDEEVLPDATNTPQIESDDSSSMESGFTTPPPTEVFLSDDDLELKLPQQQYRPSTNFLQPSVSSLLEKNEVEEEEAMDMD